MLLTELGFWITHTGIHHEIPTLNYYIENTTILGEETGLIKKWDINTSNICISSILGMIFMVYLFSHYRKLRTQSSQNCTLRC